MGKTIEKKKTEQQRSLQNIVYFAKSNKSSYSKRANCK